MQNPSSEKLEFLQKWMEGMGKCTSLKNNMSLLERKKAIKVSADLAMASTRTESKCWSRALIGNIASRDHNSKLLTEHIIGSSQCYRLRKAFTSPPPPPPPPPSLLKNKKILDRSRTKIMKRRRRTIRSRVKKIVMADSIARKLVQKRTQMLKKLVPGGDLMEDDVSLIEETLDYIQSLRSQVQVMRCLLSTSHLMKCS